PPPVVPSHPHSSAPHAVGSPQAGVIVVQPPAPEKVVVVQPPASEASSSGAEPAIVEIVPPEVPPAEDDASQVIRVSSPAGSQPPAQVIRVGSSTATHVTEASQIIRTGSPAAHSAQTPQIIRIGTPAASQPGPQVTRLGTPRTQPPQRIRVTSPPQPAPQIIPIASTPQVVRLESPDAALNLQILCARSPLTSKGLKVGTAVAQALYASSGDPGVVLVVAVTVAAAGAALARGEKHSCDPRRPGPIEITPAIPGVPISGALVPSGPAPSSDAPAQPGQPPIVIQPHPDYGYGHAPGYPPVPPFLPQSSSGQPCQQHPAGPYPGAYPPGSSQYPGQYPRSRTRSSQPGYPYGGPWQQPPIIIQPPAVITSPVPISSSGRTQGSQPQPPVIHVSPSSQGSQCPQIIHMGSPSHSGSEPQIIRIDSPGRTLSLTTLSPTTPGHLFQLGGLAEVRCSTRE
ncbi:hypothetical protein FRC11_010019, partial [Ceratobasidium sp. 423]